MRWRMLLIPAVASVALLAGCTTAPEPEPSPTPTTNGIDALEAEQIEARMSEALEKAGSFRISGTGDVEGQTADIDIAVAGKQMQGSFTVMGIEIEIIVAQDGTAYFKGGAELFGPLLGTELGDIAGKWIKIPANEDLGLIPDTNDFLAADGHYTKGEVTQYKGQPAITLVDTDGAKVYVSLVGEPYPLAVETAEGTLEFTDIGKDITIEAPSADEVLEIPTMS
ncbi:MAG: hypothetical protein IRY85_11730 [Micromonosporaceae bacterium]|nr:hypothetical protein [Micromonosporaceae bacterium]